MGLSRVAFPGTISSGDSVSSSDNNNLPGGQIGRDTATANTTGITGTTAICSTTVTVGASRHIEIDVCGMVQTDTADSAAQVTLFRDGTQIQRINHPMHTANVAYPFRVNAGDDGVSAGSHTYVLEIGVSGSGGPNISNIAATDQPTRLTVTDVGPSY